VRSKVRPSSSREADEERERGTNEANKRKKSRKKEKGGTDKVEGKSLVTKKPRGR